MHRIRQNCIGAGIQVGAIANTLGNDVHKFQDFQRLAERRPVDSEGRLIGGWFSSWLFRRGYSVNLARKLALGARAGVMPIILFPDNAPVNLAIAIFNVAFFGQQSWATLVIILPADLVPGRMVGSVAGMVGFGGALGGVVFGQGVRSVLDEGFGYLPVFAMAGSFHVLAFRLILMTIPRIEPLSEK